MSLLGCKDTDKNANTQIFFLIFLGKGAHYSDSANVCLSLKANTSEYADIPFDVMDGEGVLMADVREVEDR